MFQILLSSVFNAMPCRSNPIHMAYALPVTIVQASPIVHTAPIVYTSQIVHAAPVYHAIHARPIYTIPVKQTIQPVSIVKTPVVKYKVKTHYKVFGK